MVETLARTQMDPSSGCRIWASARQSVLLPAPLCPTTPIVWPWDTQQDMVDIANAASELLSLDTRLELDDLYVSEDYVGPDYGVLTEGCVEAMRLLARTEGVLVDPSYSGKALAGMIDHARSGPLQSSDQVVFIHTGGTPALFAYAEQLADRIPQKSP